MFFQTGRGAAHVVGWLVRFPPATHKMFHHSAIAIVFLGSGTTGNWLFGEFWVQCGVFCSRWWNTLIQTNIDPENQWLGCFNFGKACAQGLCWFQGLAFSKTSYITYLSPKGFRFSKTKEIILIWIPCCSYLFLPSDISYWRLPFFCQYQSLDLFRSKKRIA